MALPSPLPLLAALGQPDAPPPQTAREWALLGLRAKALRDQGLCGTLGDAPLSRTHGSRLFGPLLAEANLSPATWAALAVIDLGDLHAQGLALPPALSHLPPQGWLHIALERSSAGSGYGDIRICLLTDTVTPLDSCGYGFGWANPEAAAQGIAISWAPCSAPKPPSWVGFEEARTAVWGLGLSGDETLDDEDEDAFLTATEDRQGGPAPSVSLGLEPHWIQQSPASTDPRFRTWPPLLALHSGERLHLQDGGTLGIHALLEGTDPAQWQSAWFLDSH